MHLLEPLTFVSQVQNAIIIKIRSAVGVLVMKILQILRIRIADSGHRFPPVPNTLPTSIRALG